jgi:hypothetical protein
MRRTVCVVLVALLAQFISMVSAQANGLGGYAVIHPDGHVCGVIVATSNDPFGNGGTMGSTEYMGCPAGSLLVFQTKPSPTGNVAGWHGTDVTYSNGVFRLASGTTIRDGIATDPNGRVWDTGSGETITPAPSSGNSGGGSSGGVVTPETSTSPAPISETTTSTSPTPTPSASVAPVPTSSPTPTPTPTPTVSESSTTTDAPATAAGSATPVVTPTPSQAPSQPSVIATPVTEVVNDGTEEDPQGSIVARQLENGRFRLIVTTNLDSEELVIRATKKGARTVRFQLVVNQEGRAVIVTSRNLSGYRLVLFFGEDSLDSVRVN